ncbi:MAG TPA: ATP-binding protein [Acidimicrobiales bacterium]|nr:ATP-binding protein [Acidimicrobiales bacterium]
MRKPVVGSIVGIVLSVGLGAVMVPFRSHLSIATPALVLVVPVVVGVIVGGFPAGILSVVAGFVVYDLAFVPPYYAMTVGRPENWVALGVYAIVMVLVARVVASLESARSEAQRRAVATHRLFELSELLVENRSVDDLLKTIVHAVASVFDVPGVSLLVPEDGRLSVAASDGIALSELEIHQLDPQSGVPVSVGTAAGSPDAMRTVALSASGRPIGILAMRGIPASDADRAMLRTFANHAALALERAQLREQAMRSELLEEVDRLRHALMGAVSHDLRTPLATLKVASSTLHDGAVSLSDADVHELHALIDVETDHLTRLVTSLLDMTRFEAGVLEIQPSAEPVVDLVTEALDTLHSSLGDRPIEVLVPEALPQVEIDHLLIGQVLVNLLDNADRHAPPHSPITVSAETRTDRIVLSVADRGPGVPVAEREAVFDRFVRFDTGGRTGLGLTIAKTFVEAHGEHIWVDDAPEGGARFCFTLPLASHNGNRP